MRNSELSQIRREFFLEALAETGDLELSARAGGYTLRRFYQFKLADPEFAADWAAARREAVEKLAREATRRAVEGTRKYLYHQGEPVILEGENGPYHAYETNYSDTLLIFRMKALDPETYCDKIRAARIQRTWDKEDGRAGAGAMVPAEVVVQMLAALADKFRAQPEPEPPGNAS